MTQGPVTFIGGRVFDGIRLHEAPTARFQDGVFLGMGRGTVATPDARIIDLGKDILAPGYIDLQVNGGGGVMFNEDPSSATLKRIAEAHRSLGTVTILPTLITDRPETTAAAIEAVRAARREGVPGIAGLHLEGPHLSVARKGAHDAALIRPMTEADFELLMAAKADIPILKVTLAPESVSIEQLRALTQAGVIVSLGHTDADFATCQTYAEAGATCVTHLFNAMSQLGNREPGLVGAALGLGGLSAGLIADGIHVHPATMRAAWQSKARPGRIFLVSDAMAVAGTDADEFRLDGRRITRRDGRLTLEDGTLAGADLDLTQALRVLVGEVGVDLAEALSAAITRPAQVVGLSTGLKPGTTRLADVIRISGDLTGVRALDTPAPGPSTAQR